MNITQEKGEIIIMKHLLIITMIASVIIASAMIAHQGIDVVRDNVNHKTALIKAVKNH